MLNHSFGKNERNPGLKDIIDIQDFQSLMEDFYDLTGLPMSVIDLEGRVLIGVGWQDICTKFHRVHPETRKACLESDTRLTKGVTPGAFKVYKCKNNMWDVVTPIMVEDKHVGNIFAGQFFFEDERVDYEVFRGQAQRYGFNEEEYMVALEKVPRLSREKVHKVMNYYIKLARFISEQALKNVNLSRGLREQRKFQEALRENEKKYRQLFEASPISLWEEDFSQVKRRLEEILKKQEKGDLRSFFLERPELVKELASLVKVVDVNEATLKLYRARDKEEFFAGITRVFARESYESFIDALIVIAKGEKKFSLEKVHLTLEGEPIQIQLYWSVAPGYEDTYSRVLVSIVDVTREKKVLAELSSAHQRLLTILNSMDAMVYVADLETYEVLYINEYTRKRLGNVQGMKCWEALQGKTEGPCDNCNKKKLLDSAGCPSGVYHWESKNPVTGRWYDCRDTALEWIDGRLARLKIATDITERKEIEESLQNQLHFEKMVSDISSLLVSLPSDQIDRGIDHALKLTGEFFQVDRSYVFQFSEDGLTMDNTHEWCAEGIEGQKDRIQNFSVDFLPWWAQCISRDDYVFIPDVDSLPPEAEAEKREFKAQDIVSLLCVPMLKDGKLFGFLGFDGVREKKVWKKDQIMLLKVVAELISNALARHLADEKIRYLSFHDRLTDLYNRSFLEEEMNRLNNERQLPISIIMADLNGLKLVNDTYGHCVGDEMLQCAAEILRKACRKEDIVARWGGDEFVIFLPQTSREKALEVSDRIMDSCSEASIKDVPLSMSLGVSTKENPGKKLSEILREAENSMYKHKLTESRSGKNAIVNTLLKTLEEKSFETETHTRRMEKVAVQIGKRVGLSSSELSRLRLLITLHDIGKINIPEEILTREGTLTEDEWEIIKSHPETGFKIARATEEFAHVAEDIMAHHERWDGSGYPGGLKGEGIPFLARITSIADAYEVMINGRPYKRPLLMKEVLAEFKEGAGTQFDPELVKVFLEIFKKNSREEM